MVKEKQQGRNASFNITYRARTGNRVTVNLTTG